MADMFVVEVNEGVVHAGRQGCDWWENRRPLFVASGLLVETKQGTVVAWPGRARPVRPRRRRLHGRAHGHRRRHAENRRPREAPDGRCLMGLAGQTPTRSSLANEYRTNCKICPDGIYTRDEVAWARGRYLGLVHVRCAKEHGVYTQPVPLAAPAGASASATGAAGPLTPPSQPRTRGGTLTDSQIRILQLLADGHSPAEIADITRLAANTVYNGLGRARKRLRAATNDDLIEAARRAGLIRTNPETRNP